MTSTTIFFCTQCVNAGLTREEVLKHECKQPFHIVQADVSFKTGMSRWHRFLGWFYSVDFGYGFAFMGAVIINAILLPKLGLSFKTELLESFCLGCVLIRLLK